MPTCPVCTLEKPAQELIDGRLLRPAIVSLIQRDHPTWTPEDAICQDDLQRYRGRYLQEVLESDRGDLDTLEAGVLESMRVQELLSENVNEAFDEKLTMGQRLADQVASFGGSWRFIIGFAVLIFIWIVINSLVLFYRPFDPYPYILLNLALSCLAAVQAPIIMMSQNRLETRDRLRSESDYRTNLKAELEVRLLHEKVDHLLTHQWQRLLEIQALQLELMGEVSKQASASRDQR